MHHEAKEAMLDALAMLRASYQTHQNAHWRVKGDSYYGDHLLFGRLYEAVLPEIDTLAEKITAMFGCDAVNTSQQAARILACVNKWDRQHSCVVKRSLQVEEDLQRMFSDLYEFLDDTDQLTLGLDDFVMAAANAHETALYLLRQRTR